MRYRLLIFAMLFVFVLAFTSGCGLQSNESGTDSNGSAEQLESSDDTNLGSSEESNLGEDENTTASFSMESDCGICHTNTAESMKTVGSIGNAHENQQCVACHDDQEGLKLAHEKMKSSDTSKIRRLKTTEIDYEKCAACHPKNTLNEATLSSTLLTDENGTSINPHGYPETPGHNEINCGRCHIMHAVENDTTSRAPAYCLSCHHAGVYECGTCHE